MKTAKLALCAAISVWTFPATSVKVGIQSGSTGWMEATWSHNGNGPRETHTIRLNQAEIDHLIAAINRSDVWRLNHEWNHMGVPDGEAATVAIAIAGRSNRVNDAIGDSEAVDTSVLVNALAEIIRAHWQDVPA